MAAPQQLVDAIVIGTGPGGGEVAGRLAEGGLDTVAVERDLVGGEEAHGGCEAARVVTGAAALLGEAWRIPGTAGTAMARPDWRPVARRIRQAAEQRTDKRAADALSARGVRLLRGEARLTARGEVTVLAPDGREVVLHARRAVVLATGSEPALPPVPGLPGMPYWTGRDAVGAADLPGSLLVVGGAGTGLELGQAFQRFGCRTAVLEPAASGLLPEEEPEAGELLLARLAADGVDVHLAAEVAAVGHRPGRFTVRCRRGELLEAERLLVAAGRRVEVQRTGIGVLGVDDTRGFVPVDDRLRVRGAAPAGGGPGVWAVGDVTGRGCYTHVARYQADVAARAILGRGGAQAAYHAVPRLVCTDPEVGAVGLTEAGARARGLLVRAACADFGAGGSAERAGAGQPGGFVKAVAVGGVLVGATVAGPRAGEALGALTLAVRARVPVSALREVMWPGPAHRAFEEALRRL